jgi:hypothetical protein
MMSLDEYKAAKSFFFICNSSNNDISNFDSEKIRMSYFTDDLLHFFSKRSKLHMPKIGVSGNNLSLFVVPDVVCNIKSQYTNGTEKIMIIVN